MAINTGGNDTMGRPSDGSCSGFIYAVAWSLLGFVLDKVNQKSDPAE